MAERTPMVKVGGYWQELPAGDTTAGGGGDAHYLGLIDEAGPPTTASFPVDGDWGFCKDTTTFEPYDVYICYNINGYIYKVRMPN